ncbi:hypothetical protein KEH51_01335 [[Brevibacterium] frigoritolerans]|uniref:EamA domain-containing protein n=1 Tax=Peribacillus frigoritolerans TaxID=450367 RepID=A0A941J5W2_9BACI|nr:hypothetical protein [Peribacillus frigoritolerans]
MSSAIWKFDCFLLWHKNTSATSTGFLMSTTVILVPILQAFITRKLPSNKILFGVTIVSIGLALLTISGDFTFASGSLYCLVSAFLYGVQIITTSRFTREIDALKLGVYQLGFAALYATIGTFVIETPVLPHEAIDRISILSLALITAYGFVMQSIAQKYTTPESTGFLFFV